MEITVNGEHIFQLTDTDRDLDIIQNADGSYHMMYQSGSFNIQPLYVDIQKKRIRLSINHKEYDLAIADEFDILIKELGFTLNVAHKVKEIKAPMPGLVLDIMVEEGSEVEEGTPLLILEAMKMENVIKSPGIGKVKSINVKLKDAIEKGALMIEME